MKKMIRVVVAILVAFMLATSMTGCGVVKVGPGEEAVKFKTMGDDKGNLEVITKKGWSFYSYAYSAKTFPTTLQNISWVTDSDETGAFRFQSKEGLPFQADVGAAIRMIPGASAKVWAKYKKGVDEVIGVDFYNRLQDSFVAASAPLAAEEIYGEGKMAFMNEVTARIQKEFEGMFLIEKISLKGEMVLPKTVIAGIQAKQVAVQKAEKRNNEIAEAEADRLIKQKQTDAVAYDIERKAEAEAKAIQLVQKQLNASPQYVEYLKATKWDGKLPVATGGGAIPLMNLNKE